MSAPRATLAGTLRLAPISPHRRASLLLSHELSAARLVAVTEAEAAGLFAARGATVSTAGVGHAVPGPAYLGPNDLFLQNARVANPLHGYYDVAVHGNAIGVELRTASGAARLSDHRALARLIRGMPDYRDQPIRLISCDTGQRSNGLAQNLSNKLGVEVLAPDTLAWPAPANGLPVISATPSGQVVVFQPGAGNIVVTAPTRIPGLLDPVPTYPPTGRWNSFRPAGRP